MGWVLDAKKTVSKRDKKYGRDMDFDKYIYQKCVSKLFGDLIFLDDDFNELSQIDNEQEV